MATIGERVQCPKCGQESLERETRHDETREECSECGYFREATFGLMLAAELGILVSECNVLDKDKLREALKQMHFRTKSYPYIREGIIRKTEATKGQYHIVNHWFSMPSDTGELEIDWLAKQESCDDAGSARPDESNASSDDSHDDDAQSKCDPLRASQFKLRPFPLLAEDTKLRWI